MTATQSAIILGVALAALAGILAAAYRYLRPFYWRITFSLVPVVIAGVIVTNATIRYMHGQGGYKLGVDLVGGTILVYEVDQSRKLPDNYRPEQLAAALKRRIDPADLKNVTIRPVSDTRVEIILATGGKHQAQADEESWQRLLNEVRAKWPVPEGKTLDVPMGQIGDLVKQVHEQHADVEQKAIGDFIDEHFKSETGKRHLTSEEVQDVKSRIARVGSLEFRILANDHDDREAIDAAKRYFAEAQKDPKLKENLEALARANEPPPPPQAASGGNTFTVTTNNETTQYTYSWAEIGKKERHVLGLNNAHEADTDPTSNWKRMAEARAKGEPLVFENLGGGTYFGALIYSRPAVSYNLTAKERSEIQYQYYVLTRDPEKGKAITGEDLARAYETQDQYGRPAVGFNLSTHGSVLFGELTGRNAPEREESGGRKRYLAILLDGKVETAPSLNARITSSGIIEGNFTREEVDREVGILRSGALPATLKPQPVSENTMGATLGEDTIVKGTYSVAIAFAAIMVFMVLYYRFAGFVACVALLANLLLTVAFMVAVNATFTLPGLAGLVLMLGMAVDANVLIYERLREERDRGASLALAIRNGYDRAFPTIIDTHLSSIFTAIVLYTVGNDQLKGFGISLTVGLIISLFTSLYMTRLMFDVWLDRGWLHKLSMFRLLSRTSIDFMGIRYYWFTATLLLTILGIGVFILRLPQDLNIDFVGGTAYGGQLEQPVGITDLRNALGEDRQKEVLAVKDVKQLDTEGFSYLITYADGRERKIELPNAAKPEEVRTRAQVLPDLAVEQIFPGFESGNKSRYFTVRTSEKAPELVQASIGRLLDRSKMGDNGLKQIEMAFKIEKPGQEATLEFTSAGQAVAASPSQVRTLFGREMKSEGINQQYGLNGLGKEEEGRLQKMQLVMGEKVAAEKFEAALKKTLAEFKERPQPDRLETFDSQLAAETQMRAMYAILASWGAILLYLWFRFGSWTFGLAAVCCLIHDLFFTLGIIAICHHIHWYFPWLANTLQIQDFKIDLPAVAALLTLVGYSVNDTIVVFDRIREVRGKNPELTPQMINDSVNQTLSRTLLTAFSVWLVVFVLYWLGGEGVHLFAFVMVVGVIIGTYSSIYVASPLLLIFGEGAPPATQRSRRQPAEATA